MNVILICGVFSDSPPEEDAVASKNFGNKSLNVKKMAISFSSCSPIYLLTLLTALYDFKIQQTR